MAVKMAPQIGKRAVSAALAERSEPSAPAPRLWRGLCLGFTRRMLGLPWVADSAIEAWQNTDPGHRHPTGTPPVGVPVFWRGGQYGHVALSVGGGYVLSTDIRRRGKVDKVHIDLIAERWGLTYLGWTETLGPYRVFRRRPVVSLQDALRYLETNGRYPALVGKALAREKLDNTVAGYAGWQRRLGYSGDDADGRAGLTSLTRLGKAHGFKAAA